MSSVPPAPCPPGGPLHATDFGAIADGRDAHLLASWDTGARHLRVRAAVCGIAVAAGERLLRLDGPGIAAGVAFAHADVGLPIHIPHAGADGEGLTTRIARVLDARTVLLADPAVRDVAGVSGDVIWPCFLPEDIGKTLWIEGGGAFNPSAADNPPGARRHIMNYGDPHAIQARIEAVHGPGEIVLAQRLTAPGGTDIPQRIVWGSDNTAALLRAGEAAIAAGASVLHFPPGLLCAFATVQDFSVPDPPHPGIGRVFGLLRWVGDDADTFLTDTGGNVLFLRPSPATPRAFGVPARGVAGRAHLPRFAATRRPVVVIAGDSMSTAEVWNGSPHSAASSPMGALIEAIAVQNPGKSCCFVDRSIGGATWEWLDRRPEVFPGWYADRAAAWLDYVAHVPDDAGAPASPDLVILAIGGGNDGQAVSLSALESVVAKVRALAPDAEGRPPDILMMNARPSARWASVGPDSPPGTPSGNFWIFQAGREVANMLHRSFAARHGIGFLDYEDVAQRVLWGWSHARSALRRVPDTDAQECTRARPLALRRRCRDVSFYLTLPGASGEEAWRTVGALAVQVGSRPDNVAIIGTDAAGRMTLQVNAWGSATTAIVAVGGGGTRLETGGDRSTGDTLRWFMPPGSNVVIAHEGAFPFTTADIGGSILVPGAGQGGTALRSTIVAVSGTPGILYLADSAASHAKVSAKPLRWGGQFFVASDAGAAVDLVFPGAGPDGADLAARIAEVVSPTRVVLDRALPITGQMPRRLFLGRIAMPRRSLPLVVTADRSPDPKLHVYVKGTQLFVGWLTAATGTLVQAWRGPCVRYGGPFLPRVTPDSEWPVPLRATQCYIDEAMIEGQVLTDAEMWGTADALYASPWDGNGVNHLTHRQFSAVDMPLMRAQDFATG